MFGIGVLRDGRCCWGLVSGIEVGIGIGVGRWVGGVVTYRFALGRSNMSVGSAFVYGVGLVEESGGDS